MLGNSQSWDSLTEAYALFIVQTHTMPYQHLSAPYKLSVTDHHKIWLDKRDIARRLEKRDSFNSSYFLDGKKGN